METLRTWRNFFCRCNCSLFVVGAIGVATLYAESAQAACSEIRCVEQVERLYLSRSKNTLFISTSGDETSLNCSLAEDRYMSLPVDNPLFREFLAMLLTAKASNSIANIRIHENSDGCTVSYVVIE